MRNFKQELEALTEIFGFNPAEVEQGSADWHKMRLGCLSASKASYMLMDMVRPAFPSEVEIIAGEKRGDNKVFFDGEWFNGTKAQCTEFVRNKLKPESPLGRSTYMAELVAEICTAQLPDEINAKSLSWGKDNEEDARDAYSASTMSVIEQLPFIYKDSKLRAGCSPDGLVNGEHGLELKCPWSSRTFVEFVAADKIKPEYVDQCQFSMWVSDLEHWDFANFDPRMTNCKKLHIVTIERDEEMMKKIDDRYQAFIEDMDLMLSKMGVKFGEQW